MEQFFKFNTIILLTVINSVLIAVVSGIEEVSKTELGFGSECILRSRECADKRISNLAKYKAVRAVFQDALYHYCLNLMDCQAGKEQVCNNVGKSEMEYPDPDLRRRLLKQCSIWNVSVNFVETGKPTGHYIFFREIKKQKIQEIP